MSSSGLLRVRLDLFANSGLKAVPLVGVQRRPRVWSQGMTRYVTRVVVSRADETTRLSRSTTPDRELFRVTWTLNESGQNAQDFTQSHYSLSAAQAHAINLLRRVPRGVSIADIYTEDLEDVRARPIPRLAERCVCGHPTHPSQFCSCGCSISEIDNGRDASALQAAVVTSSATS